MRILVDANIVLRYILNDINDQALKAKALIDVANCVILPETLCEIVYVLYKVYRIDRVEIAKTLEKVLLKLDIINKTVYVEALKKYSDSKLDFVDCIECIYHNMNYYNVYTFDKDLNKELIKK